MRNTVMACGLLAACTALAVEPQVKSSTITLKGTCTAAEAAAARAQFDAAKINLKWAHVIVEQGDDAAIAELAAAFPSCHTFKIEKTSFTTLAPLAKVEAKEIAIRYCTIGDLAPVGANASVEKVSLYGSAVKDFSPLAKCPKLKEIDFYATKAPPEAYQTLGALKQCKAFHGGLSDMTSLAWIREVPQIETLEVFSEVIADFSPVASAANLKHFRAWNMNDAKLGGKGLIPAVGDLAFLASCTKLEKLELPGSAYSNLASLAGLRELKTVDLGGAKGDVDLSFVKGMPKLETLNASRCAGTVSGFAALAGLPALRNCDLSENVAVDVSFAKDCPKLAALRLGGSRKQVEKVTGFEAVAHAPALATLSFERTEGCALAALKPTAKLGSVSLSKGAFPEEEVKALEAALKAANPRARLNLR